MRKLDLYWKSNRDWWEYDKDFYPVLTENAPLDAWESYLRYLEQTDRREYKKVLKKYQKIFKNTEQT